MPQHPPHPRPDDPTPMPPRPDPDPPPSPEDEPGSGPDKRPGKIMGVWTLMGRRMRSGLATRLAFEARLFSVMKRPGAPIDS